MARDRRPRDDEDDDDDRPRRKRRPAADEEEEDEAPRPKKKPRVVDEDEDEPPRRVKPRVVDEDEDDEEEDRPRRRKKKKPAGMSKGLLFGLIGGGVALVGAVILLIVLLGGGGSPKSVMARVVRGLKAGDYGVVYDNMTTTAQQSVGRMPGGIGGGSSNPRDRFIETMKAAEKMGFSPTDKLGNVTILGETITGNTAVVRIRDGTGKEDVVPFIKENGVWKLGGF